MHYRYMHEDRTRLAGRSMFFRNDAQIVEGDAATNHLFRGDACIEPQQ